MRLFKTNTTKDYSTLTRVNNVYGSEEKPRKPKGKAQLQDNVIKI